jgi:hypothetical protein
MDSLVVGSARVAAGRFVFSACALAALLGVAAGSACGQAAISSTSQRPFVIGFIPVVGPGGAVGGVSVDAKGVVPTATLMPRGNYEGLNAAPRPDECLQPMRKISSAAFSQHRRAAAEAP